MSSGSDAEHGGGRIDLIGSHTGPLASTARVLGQVDARVDGLALFLGQATPDAVGLASPHGVVGTLDTHRAGGADGLGGTVTIATGGTALVLRVEEEGRIGGAA